MRFLQNLSINVNLSTLKRKIGSRFYSSSPFYSSLSQDLSLMLHNARLSDCDVVIKAGENKKELYAHSNILKARSPYFKYEILNERFTRHDHNKFQFEEPNIS